MSEKQINKYLEKALAEATEKEDYEMMLRLKRALLSFNAGVDVDIFNEKFLRFYNGKNGI